ncbi:TIR domain-containing protein [Spirosoma jeollabukense]
MKIFLSYSHEDKKIADKIVQSLKQAGHDIIFYSPKKSDNWFLKMDEAIKEVDAIIVLVSKNSLNSDFTNLETQNIALHKLSNSNINIFPVKLTDSPLPGYLSSLPYIDISNNVQEGIFTLVNLVSLAKESPTDILHAQPSTSGNKKPQEQHVTNLSKILKDGKLTLVCGAGISIDAGIPSWNNLLLRLLESMLKIMSKNDILSLKNVSPSEIQKRIGSSSLVIGKYLKTNLGNDFLPKLREAIYEDNPISCDIVDAIVELARPQRDGKPLDSIITFNYDTLIEENLDNFNIKYRSIYKEGIRNTANELPIYHVHGYLTRKEKITNDVEIVFSEDAYHTQFIEPYSWSNLIQLNKMSQNTCLLIGISLTDPNLRRLLDVSIRKDPEKKLNHYIIKKRPNLSGINSNVEDLIALLEERDANELGLNVIWVDDHPEIGPLLKDITNSDRYIH